MLRTKSSWDLTPNTIKNMAQVKTAQMSNDRLKNANATSGNNSIKSVNEMKSKGFTYKYVPNDPFVILNLFPNSFIRGINNNAWQFFSEVYRVSNRDKTYKIRYWQGRYVLSHKQQFPVLLNTYRLRMRILGENSQNFICGEFIDFNDTLITAHKDRLILESEGIEDIIKSLKIIRLSNHFSANYRIKRRDENSLTVSFDY
jgi:hypothetical protein